MLEFRSSIEKRHIAFFNVFASTDELKMRALQLLVEEILHRSPDSPGDGSTAASKRSAVPLDVAPAPESTEIVGILTEFVDVMQGRHISRRLDLDRLELFGLAVSRDDDPIPTHLANRLFERRREISLSPIEIGAWFRTYVTDLGRSSSASARVIPFPSVVATNLLTKLVEDNAEQYLTSHEAGLATGWLRLAIALRVRPKSIWPSAPLNDGQTSRLRELWTRTLGSQELIIRYWLTVRRGRDAQLARVLTADPAKDPSLLGEALVGLLRTRPTATALAKLAPELLAEPTIGEVFDAGSPFATLPAADLETLVLRNYLRITVRLGALDELIRRDAVSESVISAALKEGRTGLFAGDGWAEGARERLFDRDVSTAFLDRWLQVVDGLQDELKDQARLAIARMARRNEPMDQLAKSLVSTGRLDPNVSEMLLRLHEGTAVALRMAEALVTGTHDQANAYIERIRSAGAEPQTLEFVASQFELPALRYLSKLPDARSRTQYVNRIRELAAGDRLFQFEAMDCLIDVLDDRDIDLLVENLRYMNEATTARAVKGIVGRASIKRLRELVASENETIAVAALLELGTRDRLPSKKALMAHLHSDSAPLRMAAASLVIGNLSSDQWNPTLDAYLGGPGTHYYNVVCELDRAISQVPQTHLT